MSVPITPEQATAFLRHHRSNLPMTCFDDLLRVGYHGIKYIRSEWVNAAAEYEKALNDAENSYAAQTDFLTEYNSGTTNGFTTAINSVLEEIEKRRIALAEAQFYISLADQLLEEAPE